MNSELYTKAHKIFTEIDTENIDSDTYSKLITLNQQLGILERLIDDGQTIAASFGIRFLELTLELIESLGIDSTIEPYTTAIHNYITSL